MPAGCSSSPRKAYVPMGIEPEFDCANPQLVLRALKRPAWSSISPLSSTRRPWNTPT